MQRPVISASASTWSGTFRIFLAESLILPSGIATVAFLTRKLGPNDYGLLALAGALVIWVEATVIMLYGRVTVKWVAEAEDWRKAAGMATRLHLLTGLLTAAALFLCAPAIASMLKAPQLAGALRLFSVDIPIYALAQAHRQILVALGAFTERAWVAAARWISRMLLIFVFVGAGLSLNGAILGSIGCSIVELFLARRYVKPPLFVRGRANFPDFWTYVIPLSAFSLSMRIFDKLDLFLLKLLGGTSAVAGFYGAAQNLSLMPGIFTLSFVPLLISTMTRMLQEGQTGSAAELIQDSWRMLLVMIPVAAIVAGSANEVALLFFGKEFLPAGNVLPLLIAAAIGVAAITIHTAIFTVSAKPGWTFTLVGPVLMLGVIAYLYAIPRGGAQGAAVVTMVTSIAGAFVTGAAAYRLWRVLPPIGTVIRTMLIASIAYASARYWPAPGIMVIIKDAVLAILVFAVYFISGELKPQESEWLKLKFRQRIR